VSRDAATPDALSECGLLANAVAGKPVALGLVTDVPYTDGSTIYVPDRSGPDLRDAVVVQAALIAQGTLDPSLRPLLRSRHDGATRFLVLETARAAAAPWLLPPALRARIHDVYAGPVATSARGSAAIAAGRDPVPEPPWWFGELRLRTFKARPGGPESPGPEQSAGGAETAEDPADEPDDGTEDEGEESRILKALTTPTGGPVARALSKLFGGTSKAGGDDSVDGNELAVSGARASRDPQTGRLRRSAIALLTPSARPTVIGRTYPEWDVGSDAYRPAWCTVVEYDPAPRPEAIAPVAPADHRLRRELARLATTTQRRRHQLDGDSLDTTALVDVEVDRRLGEDTEPRIFESRLRTGRDLGVMVLLDATGSTAEVADGPTVFDEQRLMVHQLAACLEELGDRVAVQAFYSRGRGSVRFLRVKDFDGRYDTAARTRLGTLEPQGFTRLGAAIRHATHVLSTKAGTANLALVVVGDGMPYDDGYEERHAREDSRMALREALAAGVGCVSLGIRSSVPESVRTDVWGDVVSLNLERADELPQHIRPALGSALQLAASRKRAPGGTAHR